MIDPVTITLTVNIFVQLHRFIKHVRELKFTHSDTATKFIMSFEDILEGLERLSELRDEAKYLLHENYRHEIMRREIQAWSVVHSIADTVVPLVQPNTKHQSLLVTFLEGSETRKMTSALEILVKQLKSVQDEIRTIEKCSRGEREKLHGQSS